MSFRRLLALMFVAAMTSASAAAAPIDVGSRLEPVVDDTLVERLDGASLRLHPPAPREIVLRLDRPWEGACAAYFTVLQDGGRFMMYYRGRLPDEKAKDPTDLTCVAESKDGVNWTRPSAGQFEVCGTRENNVILARHRACHNFAPFLDTNPSAPAEQRFKALGGQSSFEDPNDCGQYAFVSPDGIRWRLLQDEPVLVRAEGDRRHAFDSQNVSFWSGSENCYVCYFRLWEDNVRWIGRSTSKDFVDWTPADAMTLDDKPRQHLYTSQLTPYPRAPHVYLGLPTRFMRGRRALTEDQTSALGTLKQFAGDCTDVTFISTRGGNELKRTFLEAYIRPGLDPRNWTSRANYAARGILQTGPDELSIYVQHNYGYPSAHVRRYTLRPDGFASVGAPFTGGEMITKPLRFSGDRLAINFSTSAAGSLRVEIQDADGRPIPGFALADCPEIIGDQLQRIVSWKQGPNVGPLASRPVRLRFVLKDADLFSFRFFAQSAK